MLESYQQMQSLQSSSSSSSSSDSDIIPGLPADVARHILTLIPFTHFPTIRLTSPIWNSELHSTSFHLLRNSTSLIALVHADLTSKSGKPPIFRLSLFDPSAATWHSLPLPPNRPNGLPLFCHVASLPHSLAVLGGGDPQTWTPTNEILIFDFLTGAWRLGAPMPGPRRSLFGCCARDRSSVVVVSGGHDEKKEALRSALAYDAESDEWNWLPEMREARDECGLVCIRGKIWAVGGYGTEGQGRFEKSGEGFDFEGNQKWELEEEFLESATCPRASGVGKGGDLMYVCGKGHVAVRGEGGKWRNVGELPEKMRAALQLVVVEEEEEKKVVVVLGAGMEGGAQVCYIMEEVGEGEGEEKVRWREVKLPVEYSGHVQAACCVRI